MRDSTSHNKMSKKPIYQKLWFLFRKRPILYVFIIVMISMLFSSLVLSFFPDLHPFENRYLPNDKKNHMLDMVIPDNENEFANSRFRYTEVISNNFSCIKRSKYDYEFLRLFGLNPYYPSKKETYTLVIGSQTSVGGAIVRKLKEEKKPYFIINTISDFDIGIIIPKIHPRHIRISKAIICIQPSPFRQTNKEGHLFYESFVMSSYKKLCECFTTLGIPYVLTMSPPYVLGFIPINEWFESSTVLIPYVVDSKNQLDVENPLVRMVRECKQFGKTNILHHSGYSIQSVTPEEIVDYTLSMIKRGSKSKTIITGYSSMTLDESVEIVASLYPKCQITQENGVNLDNLKARGINTIIIGKKRNISMLIKKEFSDYYVEPLKSPYLSIVVAGRNDKFYGGFAHILQKYINQIGRSLSIVPLADIEIIVVDYNPFTSKPLHKAVSIPKELENRVRFIQVPPSIHNDRIMKTRNTTDFLSNLAKNIGIRRANGEHILVTNPNLLIPTHFFEYIASRQLIDGVLYRANRFDVQDEYAAKLNEKSINLIVDNPYTHPNNPDIAAHCYEEIVGTFLMQNQRDFSSDIQCSCNEFLLASKNMWDSIGGLYEFNGKYSSELILTKFMRLVPGFIQHFLFEPVIHLDQNSSLIIQEDNVIDAHQAKKQMICFGKSNIINNDIPKTDWGLPKEHFIITVK